MLVSAASRPLYFSISKQATCSEYLCKSVSATLGAKSFLRLGCFRAHNVCWYMYSILQWPAFFLRRICFCPNNILCKLSTLLHIYVIITKKNSTVCSSPASCGFPSTNRRGSASLGQQIGYVIFNHLHCMLHAQVINITLRLELINLILIQKYFAGLRYTWRSLDDTVTHWCPKAYHPYSQGLRILLMNISPKAITRAGQIWREGVNNYFAGCALGRKLEFNNSGIHVRPGFSS